MARPHQHRVWERIADSFDVTRDRTWSPVERFVLDVSAQAARDPVGGGDASAQPQILDVMAGNGRHTRLAQEHGAQAWWSDWSRPMARRLRGRLAAPLVVSDATALPFRDASFDAVMLVAGLHGIPDEAGRARCLAECLRVLRPGGRFFVMVWAREAPRFAAMDLPPGPADVVVPWRAGGHDEERTYHLYTEASLQAALAAAGFRDVRVTSEAVATPTPDNVVATAQRPDA